MGLIDNNSPSFRDPSFYEKKRKIEKELGHEISRQEFIGKYLENEGSGGLSDTGTSTFDPVLTETMVSWYSAKGDSVIDPFAGGSVRGIVTCFLGRHYTGIDLRSEQIEANKEQADELKPDIMPLWVCGDSLNIRELAHGDYDFMITCPPYGNLEVYSDDPADISNMNDDDFDAAYTEIMKRTCGMLKEDRFAVVVVGNYRTKKGYLRDLVGLTVRAMESAGARYYNDFIFVTSAGSLPIRVGKMFASTRKMGRTHQYCLCFVKGDPKKATERLGDVDIPDMSEYFTIENGE